MNHLAWKGNYLHQVMPCFHKLAHVSDEFAELLHALIFSWKKKHCPLQATCLWRLEGTLLARYTESLLAGYIESFLWKQIFYRLNDFSPTSIVPKISKHCIVNPITACVSISFFSLKPSLKLILVVHEQRKSIAGKEILVVWHRVKSFDI